MKQPIIAFDADDTLWVNEPIFRETEQQFCQLLLDYSAPQHTEQLLIVMELKNLEVYGYGIKGFTLSMIETALQVSNNSLKASTLNKIIQLGKNMLDHPVEIMEGVPHVLQTLKERGYRMIVVTKGDLLEQQRKLKKSNLAPFFHHVEVLSEKVESNYLTLLHTLGIAPNHFVMIGNSLKSDILPAVHIGATAFYIPFHTTWIHEEINPKDDCPERYTQLEHISQVLEILLP